MHTLAMIDMETRTADAIISAPIKQRSKGENFGTVLKKTEHPRQQQPASKPASKPAMKSAETPARSQEKGELNKCRSGESQNVVNDPVNVEVEAETDQAPVQSEATPILVQPVDGEMQAETQQSLVDWLNTLLSEESMATAQDVAEVELVLAELVQELDLQELDLQGLEALTLDNGGELLGQLLAQVDSSLAETPELNGTIEQLANLLAELPQVQGLQGAPVETEVLVVARQLLQQIVAVVGTGTTKSGTAKGIGGELVQPEVVATQEQPIEDLLVTAEGEDIDPRFAGLLKPRAEQMQVPVKLASQNSVPSADGEEPVLPELTEEMVLTKADSSVEQPVTTNAKHGLEALISQVSNSQHGQNSVPVKGLAVNQAVPQAQTIQLPSGQQISESQIFDQVVTHISGSVNGESGRMVLRLQPAELGSLKLELTIEGDKIRANLHAQTQQVQEVLERNLPQLRSALAEQGLKIDQFQVNIDKNSDQQSQFENLSQQQHGGSQQQSSLHQAEVDPEELNIPLAHLLQNGGGGISLHV